MAQNLEVLKLAGMIFDLTKEENRHCIYNFPNLNPDLQDRSVDLEFNYDKKEDNLYFSIEIRSENLIVNSDCGDSLRYNSVYTSPTIDTVSELQKQLNYIANTIIPSIKFDVFLGIYTSEDTKNCPVQQINELVQKIYNKKDEECCVCMERTITKTPCKHILCFLCWEKLKILKCPCCRSNIRYVHKNMFDSDEE